MSAFNDSLPPRIDDEAVLDELLTRPSDRLVQFIKSISSPLLILGAGGKMGPTMAVMAKRAAQAAGHPLEIIAVSRFGTPATRSWLEERGVSTVSCDLLEADQVSQLPDAENILSLVGLKFGTSQNPHLTWAINTVAVHQICERFRTSRIAVLSTGNVYPLTDVVKGGAMENYLLTPLGEYANAAIARERLFQYYSQRHGTPVALLRLFFSVELRYGVLVDIVRKVNEGKPIHLANGSINCIWQGDANDITIRALSLAMSPATVWNLCRPEVYSVRDIALRAGEILGRPPRFIGTESGTAILGKAETIFERLGPPSVTLDRMLGWITEWVKSGGRNLERPTHFETRDGIY